MKKILCFLFFLGAILIAQVDIKEDVKPYVDTTKYEVSEAFKTDSSMFIQLKCLDGSGSFGYGIPDNMRINPNYKNIVDSVQSWIVKAKEERENER